MSNEISRIPEGGFKKLSDVSEYFERHNRELEDRLRRIEAANKSAFVVMNGTATYTGATYTLDVAGTSLANAQAFVATLVTVLKRGGKIR